MLITYPKMGILALFKEGFFPKDYKEIPYLAINDRFTILLYNANNSLEIFPCQNCP